ncbi:MAG TPA: chemotaxis response regulator protein-glutamate methylesterase [Candidatus Binatia bacterium]|nr:chemotaxis response regulator protein-glutamate methylesterase [Candidatus Binatia bacterium]
MERRIRILVTDDSAFMRRAIARMLEGEDDFEIVATAASGEEAVKKARELAPDVITMDVEMPGIGGLEAIKQLTAERNAPIIMVSALTREGAEITLRGLELGAIDFILKPDSAYVDIVKLRRELVDKVRTFGRRPAQIITPMRPRARPVRASFGCVMMGASTGGPIALARIVSRLPGDFPIPIIIVQHMPPGFTKPLADRLASAGPLDVVEGTDGMALVPYRAILAPAGVHLRLHRSGDRVVIVLEEDELGALHVPSIDVTAASVAEVFEAAALAIILTGMGQDGVAGLRVVKERGGYVIGQDAETSVVYGMPRAAAAAGLVDRVAGIDEIPELLRSFARPKPG